MLLELRNAIGAEEFDYCTLMHALARYSFPRGKINSLLKKGHIVRVKKGIYVWSDALARRPYSKELIANMIYGPSYVSCHYALSFYGMIPERVETVTSVTNKRNKSFSTPIGDFSYRYIRPAVYTCGIELFEGEDQRSFLIASREKALLDTLYCSSRPSNARQLRERLFDDLRVERSQLRSLRKDLLKSLCEAYGSWARPVCDLLAEISDE